MTGVVVYWGCGCGEDRRSWKCYPGEIQMCMQEMNIHACEFAYRRTTYT